MEAMFKKWLAENGAEVDAMIFRSPKDWCSDLYIYRFRFGDGEWSSARVAPWGMDVYAQVTEVIEGAKP